MVTHYEKEMNNSQKKVDVINEKIKLIQKN